MSNILWTQDSEEESMVEIITNINGIVNNFVWGIPMLILLVGTGILMTALTKEIGRASCRERVF